MALVVALRYLLFALRLPQSFPVHYSVTLTNNIIHGLVQVYHSATL